MKNKKTLEIHYDAVNAILVNSTKEDCYFVQNLLSYETGQGHGSYASFSSSSSLFSFKSKSFPSGFVRFVEKRAKFAGYSVIIKTVRYPLPVGTKNPKVDNFPEDARYSYQKETADIFIAKRRMIAQIATGGGKSRIFKLCQRKLGLPTLFVTTRKSLMFQMAENYKDSFSEKVGIIGDGIWEPVKDGCNFAISDTLYSRINVPSVESVVDKEIESWNNKIKKAAENYLESQGLPFDKEDLQFASPQIKIKVQKIKKKFFDDNPLDERAIKTKVERKLQSQIEKREETLEFLRGIQFLCLEEAHEVSSNSFYEVANSCRNAHYRLALTATPFMKGEEEANMKLMACTGPIEVKVSEKKLIDLGILAKPYFKYLSWSKPEGLMRGTPWQRAYKIGIVENEIRNIHIINEALRARDYGLSVLILVQSTAHGRNLNEQLVVAGLKSEFISGKDDQNKRKDVLSRLQNKSLNVVIGSTILDVGVDVPSIGVVIIAGGGKAEVGMRQRIGRGLREKKEGPNVAFIIDFEDRYNKHLIKHYKERRNIVETTPGFAENIVKEFDYKSFGLVRSSAQPPQLED